MNNKYTIIIKKNECFYKISKVFFGKDGSYYVTVPYHKERKGWIWKFEKNFPSLNDFENMGTLHIPMSAAIDVASSDENIIKLSHHPDGFVQFSGKGIISGKDPSGNVQGVGIHSWTLRDPAPGPSFVITINGVEDFEQVTNTKDKTAIIFSENAIVGLSSQSGYVIEGFYFPKELRRFVYILKDGSKMIQLTHPSKCIMTMKVILPPEDSEIQGFIGLSINKSEIKTGVARSGFFISAPTQFTFNKNNSDVKVTTIFCSYPRGREDMVKRSLNYGKYIKKDN
ncbi:MAG: hypothetical protein HQ579_07735 [Candidatus Omnitrophica bacterium]|nr:hypothetical protein [Candidatus Omnitrophota bacterium]